MASRDSIVFEVKDGIASTIERSLTSIESRTRSAATALERLNKALAGIQPKGLTELSAAYGAAAKQLDAATASAGRFAAAMAAMTPAQARASAAQNAAALAAQKLATEQQRTAAAAAKAGVAQQQLAAALGRAQGASAGAATASQKLATEQQRTAREAANAATASDRAAMAALRLKQAQDKTAESTAKASSALGSYARSAAASLAAGLSAGAILKMADAYVVLQNKLQNVTTSQAQVNELTEDLFKLANETRSSVQDTATAFTRFDRSLKQMGKSQKDTLQLTETINKALVVSGATAGESAAALLQLSQAFNSGRLQGDEFRSVSENMPVVLDAVAKVLNKPINQIKKLGSEGKITSKILFEAFTLMRDQVNETFAKTTPTLSQGFEVLKNQAIQFLGQINSSLGVTEGLSRAMIWLGSNLKIVAVAATAVGTALLIAFAPAIIAAISAATSAVVAFTVALAKNPFGLLAIAIASTIAYLTLFKDEIKLGTDATTTLGDLMTSVWASITGVVSEVYNSITDFFNSTDEKSRATFDEMTANAEAAGQYQEATWLKVLRTILQVFDMIAGAARGLVAGVIQAFLAMVDGLSTQFQNIGEMASKAFAGDFKGILEVAKKSKTQVLAAGAGIGKAFAKGFSEQIAWQVTGGFEAMLDERVKDAKKLGDARTAASKAGAGSTLRGAGVDTTGGGGDDGKSAEKRAAALSKVNLQLDNELDRMFKLQPARETQQKLDQIEEELAGKKIKLNQQERDSIIAKIQAINDAKDVQQQFDRIYAAATVPQRDYNASLTAAQKLLDMGAISQERYNSEVAKAKDAYTSATVPFAALNKEITEQLSLSGMLNSEREIEQQLIQARNTALAAGLPYSQQEVDLLRERLKLVQQSNLVDAERNKLQQDSQKAKSDTFTNKVTAASSMISDPSSGYTSGDAVNSMVSEVPGLKDTGSYFQAQQEQYAAMYAKIDELRQADVISEKDAALAKFSAMQQYYGGYLDTASNALSGLTAMQNSENKKQAAIGKTAAIAQTIIQTYKSATGAYSAMAPIPFVGPVLGVAAAAAAVASGLANVQKIRSQGYMAGGYTGNIPTHQVAGDVHGQEYVFDAEATKRIGVGNLEAIRRGASNLTTNNVVVKNQTATATDKPSDSIAKSNLSQVRQGYTQIVNLTLQGKPDRKTPEQSARAIRKETTKEFTRNN